MNRATLFVLTWGIAFFSACDSGPREISGEPLDGGSAEQIFPVPGGSAALGAGLLASESPAAGQPAVMRTVTALEALETERYSYVRVQEGGEEFWIAVMKQDIRIGGSYLFSGGLSKQGFQSQELNRFFDRVLLVSDFRPAAPAQPSAAVTGAAGQQVASAPDPGEVEMAAGSVKLSDLVANLSRYEGKTVQVTGKCVKVNSMIMGRNWLHLQDGSGVDLTVTTVALVNPGDIVTMEGTIALNRDFGAGYRYDYIMEAAIVKH
jgi:hypothetical protein